MVPYGRIFFGSSNEKRHQFRNCNENHLAENSNQHIEQSNAREDYKKCEEPEQSNALLTSWQVGIPFLQIFPVYQKYIIPYLQHDWMGCHLTVNLTTCPKRKINLSPNMFWQDHTGQSNLHTKNNNGGASCHCPVRWRCRQRLIHPPALTFGPRWNWFVGTTQSC